MPIECKLNAICLTTVTNRVSYKRYNHAHTFINTNIGTYVQTNQTLTFCVHFEYSKKQMLNYC